MYYLLECQNKALIQTPLSFIRSINIKSFCKHGNLIQRTSKSILLELYFWNISFLSDAIKKYNSSDRYTSIYSRCFPSIMRSFFGKSSSALEKFVATRLYCKEICLLWIWRLLFSVMENMGNYPAFLKHKTVLTTSKRRI